MSNPIFQRQQNQPNSPNNIEPSGLLGLFKEIKNSPDPNAAMQQLLLTNPQYKAMVDYINQNGGDARTAFYNLAAQKGINPQSILNQLQ